MKQCNTNEYEIMQHLLFFRERIQSDHLAIEQINTLQRLQPGTSRGEHLPRRRVVRNILAYAQAMEVLGSDGNRYRFMINN